MGSRSYNNNCLLYSNLLFQILIYIRWCESFGQIGILRRCRNCSSFLRRINCWKYDEKHFCMAKFFITACSSQPPFGFENVPYLCFSCFLPSFLWSLYINGLKWVLVLINSDCYEYCGGCRLVTTVIVTDQCPLVFGAGLESVITTLTSTTPLNRVIIIIIVRINHHTHNTRTKVLIIN